MAEAKTNEMEKPQMKIKAGFDDTGDEYDMLDEFWGLTDDRTWYVTLDKYWKGKNADNDAMLGGMQSEIHKIDIQTSMEIVRKYWPKLPKLSKTKQNATKTDATYYALDCGAGIGRVTQHVLGPMFDRVDLVEINAEFCKMCKQLIGNKKYFGQLINKSLHEFEPKTNHYACIWCQWTLEHLTDDDLIEFLKRCKLALIQNNNAAYCVFKENVCRNNLFYVNTTMSSMIRHQTVLIHMFEKAGLNVANVIDQKGFPSDLWPQKIFILNCCRVLQEKSIAEKR